MEIPYVSLFSFWGFCPYLRRGTSEYCSMLPSPSLGLGSVGQMLDICSPFLVVHCWRGACTRQLHRPLCEARWVIRVSQKHVPGNIQQSNEMKISNQFPLTIIFVASLASALLLVCMLLVAVGVGLCGSHIINNITIPLTFFPNLNRACLNRA